MASLIFARLFYTLVASWNVDGLGWLIYVLEISRMVGFMGTQMEHLIYALCLLSQISSYDGSVLQAPRVQDSMSEHSQTFVISQILKCPLVKPGHMAKSKLKGERNRFHILIEGASKSHCRET